ncbi:MAG: PAS domain S-box protein [Proteobacteria bacterium]|nr:PAS domain S-box protein [Pseudomonadota bacterium]
MEKNTPQKNKITKEGFINKHVDEKPEACENLASMPYDELKAIAHELSVHQIELEMQNDELHRIQEELENTRDKYTNLYDYSPVGYATINEKGIITDVNLTLVFMLETDRGQVIGKHFSRFIFIEDQDLFYEFRRKLMANDSFQSLELRLVKKGNTLFYANIECMTVKTIDRSPRQIRMAVTDTTRNKKSENKRQSHGQSWLATFNLLSDWVSIIDINTGIILDTNTAGERLLGKTRSDIIGQTFRSLVSNGTGTVPNCPLEKMLKSGKQEITEIYLAKGHTWLSVTTDPIQDEHSQIHRAVHIARDITEQKRSNEAIRLHEERYRQVVNNANEGIVVIQDGLIVFANPKVSDLVGLSGDDLIDLPVFTFIHPDDRDMVSINDQYRMDHEKVPGIYRFRFIDKNKAIKWIRTNSIGIRWEKKPATLNFLTDITEIVRCETKQQGIDTTIIHS